MKKETGNVNRLTSLKKKHSKLSIKEPPSYLGLGIFYQFLSENQMIQSHSTVLRPNLQKEGKFPRPFIEANGTLGLNLVETGQKQTKIIA